jgi:hypothetical protein
MSALRRARTVLGSVYRFLFEPQPLADLRDQAGHEMILRPLSRFANRTAKPDLEAPVDTTGDDAYELTVAASDGGLSDTPARSATMVLPCSARAKESRARRVSFALPTTCVAAHRRR